MLTRRWARNVRKVEIVGPKTPLRSKAKSANLTDDIQRQNISGMNKQ